MRPFSQKLVKALEAHCSCLPFLRGSVTTLSGQGVALVAEHFHVCSCKAMQLCLAQGYWPLRFARNAGVLDAAGQSALLASHALVAGCGGLGGHVASLLARAGVGALSLCDGDSFGESNLNRQAFCREDNIGRLKASVAAEEIAAIASHVQIRELPFMLDSFNVQEALDGVDIVLDCLDTPSARMLLAKAAARRNIPFVHGAIAGFEGFMGLILPGDDTLKKLYGAEPPLSLECAEHILGVPAVTPAAAAAFQVALALQHLAGMPLPAKTMFHLDVAAPLLEMLRL